MPDRPTLDPFSGGAQTLFTALVTNSLRQATSAASSMCLHNHLLVARLSSSLDSRTGVACSLDRDAICIHVFGVPLSRQDRLWALAGRSARLRYVGLPGVARHEALPQSVRSLFWKVPVTNC